MDAASETDVKQPNRPRQKKQPQGGERPSDHRRLDCNENGMSLSTTADVTTTQQQLQQKQQLQQQQQQQQRINASKHGTASLTSGLDLDHTMAQSDVFCDERYDCQSFSPEDTLNNDFFYDDEFTVPFDANLAEGFGSQSSTDGGCIKSLSCRSLSDPDDNLRWQINTHRDGRISLRMTESKSDSCLYQADLEMSDSERDMSTSEHDMSSPDMSQLHNNQPLFSSHSDACNLDGACNGGEDLLRSSCISESLSFDGEGGSEDGKHERHRVDCYNWSLNKQKYFLSFDRSPTKTCSSGDDSSCHQLEPSGTPNITNWAKTSPTQSKCSTKKKGSTESASTSKESDSKLTTWRQVKQTKPVKAAKLTSWQKLSSDHKTHTVVISDNKLDSDTSVLQCDNSIPSPRVCRKKTEKLLDLTLPSTVVEKRSVKGDKSKIRSTSSPARTPAKLIAIYQNMKNRNNAELAIDQVSVTSDLLNKEELQHHSQGYNCQADDLILEKKNNPNNCWLKLAGVDNNCGNTTDRCIQTSVQVTACETANKCMQTSLQEIREGRALGCTSRSLTSGPVQPKDRMLYSAYLISKPLPDLSFLNNSRSFLRAKTLDGEEPKQHCQLRTKSASCVGDQRRQPGLESFQENSSVCTQKKDGRKLPLRCKSAEYRGTSSSSDSRETSPHLPNKYRQRSRSSDSTSSGAYSGGSTSSSGIDPGSYDSSGTVRCSEASCSSSSSGGIHFVGSEKDLRDCRNDLHHIHQLKNIVPRKPPRLFPAVSGKECDGKKLSHCCSSGVTTVSSSSMPIVILCNTCNSRNVFANIHEYTTAMVFSHPTYYNKSDSSSSEDMKALKNVEYLQISPVRSSSRTRDRLRGKSLTDDRTAVMTSKQQSSPRLQKRNVQTRTIQTQPAKSILVRNRQRNQMKHRSWSDTQDSDSTSETPSDRPVSMQEEILQAVDGFDTAVVAKHTNEQPLSNGLACVKQSWHSLEERDTRSPDKNGEGKMADNEERDYDRFRAKKSVSFSEKIFYHSSSATASPLDSPSDHQRAAPVVEPISNVGRVVPSRSSQLEQACGFMDMKKLAVITDDVEMPPSDFMVSPSFSPSSSLSGSSESSVDIVHKRELVLDVMKAVETLLKYFSQTRDHSEKVRLGNTKECPEVGRLVLEHLCPAIQAIILDGQKPHVNSLFGKVKNSPWKFVEDSAEMGQSVEAIHNLVKSLKSLKFLNTPWLFFNAFICGLLNYHAVDFWLTYVHTHRALLSKHYSSSAFLMLSNSTTQRLFLDLITSLQPLAQMPLRLEYDFERRHLDQRHQQHLAEFLLNDHVSRSVETYVEGQQFLSQWQKITELNNIDKSLEGSTGVKLRPKDLLQNTRRHLRERLGETQQLTSSGVALARNVFSFASGRRPRPTSLPGNLVLSALTGTQAPSEDDVTPTNTATPRLSLITDSTDSECSSSASLWQQFARQIKSFKSGSEKLYRREGYSFDKASPINHNVLQPSETAMGNSDNSNKEKISGVSAGSDSGLVTSNIPKTCSAPDSQQTKHSVSSDRMVQSNLQPTSTVTLRNSSSRKNMESSKRWSDFGVHLVNFMDKLLLSDSSHSQSSTTSSQKSFEGHSVGQSSQGSERPGINKCRSDNMITQHRRGIGEGLVGTQSLDQITAKHEDCTDTRFYNSLCHYLATDEAQLSFEKGTIFAVVREIDSDWLMCRHGDREGLVHRACVKPVDRSES